MRYLVFLLLLTAQAAFGQCCPYLQPVQVIPANPTATDNIRLVFRATTGNRGAQIGSNLVRTANAIAYTGCYYSGLLTSPQSYTDTVRLGPLAPGSYSISFLGIESSSMQQCQEQRRNTVSATFQVGNALATRDVASGWSVFPIPASSRVLSLAIPPEASVQRVLLLDATGRTCFTGTGAEITPHQSQWEMSLPALPAGLYTLFITPASGAAITQRVVLQ